MPGRIWTAGLKRETVIIFDTGLAFTPIFNPGGGAALLWLGLDIGWGF